MTDRATIPSRLLERNLALTGALILFALLGGPLLAGWFYLFDDLYTFHLPLRVFFDACLAAGDDFRWFPAYYGGLDLHGEGQMGLTHPAHLILYGLLPVRVAYPVEFLLHYLLLMIGTTVLLRSWLDSDAAAIVGGILFTFFGFNTFHFMHINAIGIIAHLPWSLWLIGRLFRDPARSRRAWGIAAGLAMLTGSELLLGYPQMFWLVKCAEGLFVLFLTVIVRSGRGLAVYVGATAVGVLLGGVQLVPTWEALGRSRRAELRRENILHGSIHPLNLTQLVAPYLFRERCVPEDDTIPDQPMPFWELGVYQGALVVPLLVWLTLGWSELQAASRRLAGFGLVLAVIGLLLALGRHGPLAELLVHAPLLNKFRIPARHLMLMHLGLAILAAVAVESLLRADPAERRRRVRRAAGLAVVPLATVLVCGGAWLAQRQGLEGFPGLATPRRILFNVPLVAAATAFVGLSVRWPKVGLAAMLLFAAADQALYVLYLSIWDNGCVRSLDEAIRNRPALPPVPPGYRLDLPIAPRPAPCLPADVSLAGLAMTDGYVGLVPRRLLDYNRPGPRRLAGVAWVWNASTNAWQPAPQPPLPRARFVARTVVSDDPARLDEIDLATTAIVGEPLPIVAGPAGEVTIRQDRPGRIVLDVAVATRQLLVVNESYHPGWVATIQGRRRAPVRANFDFLGVLVPPGRSTVILRFRPVSFTAGLAVSGAGLAILCGWGVLRGRPR